MINLADYKDAIIARLQKMSPKELQNRLQAKGYDVIVTNKIMKNTRPPSNTESLIRLKDQGFKVKIVHARKVKSLILREDGLRCYKELPEPLSDSHIRTKNGLLSEDVIPQYKYLPMGGATILDLTNGDEKITVQATCYAKDRFSRREGVKICLTKLKELYGIECD